MSSLEDSTRAASVLAHAREIVEESMRARQEHARRMAGYRHERSVVAEARRTARSYGLEPARVTVARPVVPLDEDAFDRSVSVFHRAYFHAYKPAVPSDHDEAHQEALRDALEAFLGCYEETRR